MNVKSLHENNVYNCLLLINLATRSYVIVESVTPEQNSFKPLIPSCGSYECRLRDHTVSGSGLRFQLFLAIEHQQVFYFWGFISSSVTENSKSTDLPVLSQRLT